MALTVVGRLILSSLPVPITRLYGMVQDPVDFDSFYCLVYTAPSLRVYKFTWPDTMVELADTGIAWDSTAQLILNGVVFQDIAFGIGYLDETYHYGFIVAGANEPPYVTGAEIGDLNLTTLAFTSYEVSAAANAMFSWSRLVPVFDGTGSYLAAGGGSVVMKKRYGVASGSYTSVGGDAAVWMEETDQTWATYGVGSWYRIYAQGTPSRSLITTGATYLPRAADIPTAISLKAGDSVPNKTLLWDDEYRYLLFSSTSTGGGAKNLLVAVRKHIGSGSYSFKVLSSDVSVGSQRSMFDAWDIWQTGATGAAGTIRKIWFTADGFNDKIYCSLAWPMDMDNYVTIDEGGVANNRIIWVATSGEYAYVLHWGGDNYGTSITKLLDTDLVAGTADSAISAPGAVTLWKDKRVFFAGVTNYLRYLWWSQPYEPQSLDVGWDGYNTTVFDDEDIKSLINLEDSVYCGSKKGWMRLRGKSPDHWQLDQTLATEGPMNHKTVAVTPYGAIYPRPDGLWIFNGYTSRIFFEQGKELMSQPNWDSIDKMFSLWDGRFFRFFYPNGSATSNDRELVIDLIGGIENPRGTESDRAAASGLADITTQTIYLGDESGNILTEGGGSASRSFEITTKEYPAENLVMAGTFAKLHYDLDAAGAVVAITPIYDGVSQTPINIPTNSGRTRSHILLPKGNAFRVGIKLTATTDAAVKIYEPWILE